MDFTIQKPCRVFLRYHLKNQEGETLENTWNHHPIVFPIGTGDGMPLFEDQLEGLKIGDEKSFSFRDPEGIGFQMEIIIDGIEQITEESVNIQGEKDCGPGCCC